MRPYRSVGGHKARDSPYRAIQSGVYTHTHTHTPGSTTALLVCTDAPATCAAGRRRRAALFGDEAAYRSGEGRGGEKSAGPIVIPPVSGARLTVFREAITPHGRAAFRGSSVAARSLPIVLGACSEREWRLISSPGESYRIKAVHHQSLVPRPSVRRDRPMPESVALPNSSSLSALYLAPIDTSSTTRRRRRRNCVGRVASR